MTKRLANLTVMALAAGLLLGGCKGKNDQANKPQEKKRIIAVSVLTMTNPFFKEIADNMADEAKKHGFEVIVADGNQKAETQYAQVKDFITKQVNAIVLTPCDSKAVASAIREANDAGIPVFTADIACLDKSVEIISHIATDNEAGGRKAADAMMKAIDNKGKVMIVDYPEVESVILRTKGFRAQLAAKNSPIQILEPTLPGRGAKDVSFKVVQDALGRPDARELAGIFAINDPSALGAYAALEKAGLAGKIKIVGFDGQPEGRQAIKDGKIFADPIQSPDLIGRKTVQTIMKYLNGEKVAPEVLIPTKLLYKEGVEEDAASK